MNLRFAEAIGLCRCQNSPSPETPGEADTILKGLDDDISLRIPGYAVHYRNALELIPAATKNKRDAELRARAQAWFDDHIERGYGCFRPFARQA